MRTHLRPLTGGLHKVEIYAIPAPSRRFIMSMRFLGGGFSKAIICCSLRLLSFFPFHYIFNDHAGAQLIWRIAMSSESMCAFTAFLRLARDGPVSVKGRSGLLHI